VIAQRRSTSRSPIWGKAGWVWRQARDRCEAHLEYIEQRIAVQEADSHKRKARAPLINVAQTERKIADLDRQAKAIENEIQTEEHRTGIHDPAHVAYPSAAKGMIERCDRMMSFIDVLKRELVHGAKGPAADSGGDYRRDATISIRH
jgi:predicted phage-related endonuclease